MSEFMRALERMRAENPPMWTIKQFMPVRGCTSRTTVYEDGKKIPGLIVKPFGAGGPVRIMRDVWLDHLAAAAINP